MYAVPTNLLSKNNSKTIKGEKFGVTTYIMYLAPYNQNSHGKNLCSHATKGCASACLFKSGAARFNSIQLARINKSNYFIENRNDFMLQLYNEIKKYQKLHNAMDVEQLVNAKGKIIRSKKMAIRLNGTSDIPFENIKFSVNGEAPKNIMEHFSDIQFYDYTKNYNRFSKVLPFNYHLTFSRSETNHEQCIDLLNRGFNVAYVFYYKGDLPSTYNGFKVINGDKSDLRFLDDENVIVGLKYKYMTGKGTRGKNLEMINDNKFIINLEKKEKKLVGVI